ncbi:MAG: DUF4136 domain-containing protein [Acidobacteriota bacterium]|nr:DUF4136 domain-containing protein [Acidobacteriota bacterium]
MSVKSLFAVALVTLMLPATSHAQQTRYAFNRFGDFSTYKTYTMKDGTKAGDPLIDTRVVTAIEQQLQAKGLKRSDTAPDLVVVYHMALNKPRNISAFSTGIGDYGPYPYQWGAGWGSTDVRVSQIAAGTLVIDVIDAHQKDLVWRGIGVNEVDALAEPMRRDQEVQLAVTSILANYPPKPTVVAAEK